MSILLHLLVAGSWPAACVLQAEEDPALVLPPPRSPGEKVALAMLPVAVQRTMRKEGGEDLAEAYRRTDATGATVYIAHIIDAEGIHQLLTVTEDGEIDSREQERKRDNTQGLTPPADPAIVPGPTPTSTIPPAGSLSGRPAQPAP